MSDFELSNQYWIQSPGYLLIEVPDAVKADIQQSIAAVGKTPSEDARSTLRGHIDEESLT